MIYFVTIFMSFAGHEKDVVPVLNCGMHLVGKIVKLESFLLESSVLVLVYTWKIV